MIKCVNCGNLIENNSDFCYFCGHDPYKIKSQERFIASRKTMSFKSYKVNIDYKYYSQLRGFDYELHGKNPLYQIEGTLGRRLFVYEHKCVIKVEVTLGALISHNATDGEKTIYYKDVIGVQFKKRGIAIGYLQLETASSKDNNNNSNFFNENSFTFEDNEKVYEAYRYIINRLDEIKSI